MAAYGIGVDWVVIAVQWLQVLLGILWFGNALVLDVIVIPAINRLPIVTQREISSYIGSRATPIFRAVVPLIIILGFVRGTILGPIKSHLPVRARRHRAGAAPDGRCPRAPGRLAAA